MKKILFIVIMFLLIITGCSNIDEKMTYDKNGLLSAFEKTESLDNCAIEKIAEFKLKEKSGIPWETTYLITQDQSSTYYYKKENVWYKEKIDKALLFDFSIINRALKIEPVANDMNCCLDRYQIWLDKEDLDKLFVLEIPEYDIKKAEIFVRVNESGYIYNISVDIPIENKSSHIDQINLTISFVSNDIVENFNISSDIINNSILK